MKGFIKNETNKAVFRLQRSIPVNGTVLLENAFLSVGEKSGKKTALSFAKYLKENHFPEEGWVFCKEDGSPLFKEVSKPKTKVGSKEPEVVVPVPKKRKKVTPGKGAGKKLTRNKEANEVTEITAGAIIDAAIPQAKSLIAKTKDRGILKKALTLSSHFSNKEEHRRLVQRRLEEVY